MLKVLPLIAIVAIATRSMASREIRSPGGSGWQGSSFGSGLPSIGVARSSFPRWSGSGTALGRSGGYGSSGWSGTQGFGSSGRSASTGHLSGGGGWGAQGYSSKNAYSGNGYNSNGGWGSSSADWGDSTYGSSNSWDDSGLGRSSNGW